MSSVTQGWDFEPEIKSTGGAGFVSIPHKGSVAKIRIVAAPVHFKKETNFEGKKDIAQRHLCLVIERKPEGDEVKILEIGNQIYIEIRKYLADPDWGDITQYDFKITRNKEKTSDSGSEPFYSISANPKKSSITEREEQMIRDAKINLTQIGEALSYDKVANSSKSVEAKIGSNQQDNTTEEDLPF